MEQGRFEDIIKKKFKDKGQQVPASIWKNVNSTLDADLVSKYQSSHSRYRWLAAAAVLVAAFSFAFQYGSFFNKKSSEEATYYNALLSQDVSYSLFDPVQVYLEPIAFSGIPITYNENDQSENSNNIFDDYSELPKHESISIQRKEPRVEYADASGSINSFYRALNPTATKKKNNSKSEFWAGLEAGAGKFSPNFSGTNSISSSVNTAAAATAVGGNEFSNPSATAIQNDMQDGTATSVGFDFGMKLGKKWTLESGLAYTNINNAGSASLNVFDAFSRQDDFQVSGQKPEEPESFERDRARDVTSFDGDVAVNSNMQFASLPVKAGYYLMDNRFSLRLNAGFAANYLIENSLSDPSRQIINGSQPNVFNDWSFDGIGGLEFGYRLFDKIDMTIEPNYRYSITPLSNSINSPSRFVVQTGFRYTLR